MHDLVEVSWFKSSYSNANSECVEVAHAAGVAVPVRDSKDPSGPSLVFPENSWGAFIGEIKAGNLQNV
ncbi:DUF397 domain-containing protein [Kitasatospora sp. RB6PN24]|uniref:DUF397 domain-containing protein n=1 Tax=Kitasatospora humi TaxID=2893891 RepID=UPI001E30C40D|nr:DUF397 domain-containing protein [Kitasatospora humi]MCC9310429.1 DUF397 domain-containing protein [Kitasatospora humi]